MTWAPVEEYGMTYSPDLAVLLADLEQDGDWDSIPLTMAPVEGLLAIEQEVKVETVERTIPAAGFRSGYWPYLARVGGRLVVIDGHHRVAAHWFVGDTFMEAKIMELDS